MKRRILLWLLVIAFIWIIITRLVEIENLLETVANANLIWLAAAIFFEICFLVIQSAIYQATFHSVDLKSPLQRLLPLSLASFFINVVAPSGGAAGVALFADDANRRGQSGARAAAGYLLQVVVDYIAFILVLAIGLAYLYQENNLHFYQITGTLIFLLLTLGLVIVLLLGRWQPALLKKLLIWIRSVINGIAAKIKRPALLSDTWAENSSQEFSTAAFAVSRNPKRMFSALLFALLRHSMGILSLYATFQAFHYSIAFGPLVAGYAVSLMLLIVSITPQGVGILEGIYVLMFRSLAVPGAVATAVGLTYRGLTFWFPFTAGFILIRLVPSFKSGRPHVNQTDPPADTEPEPDPPVEEPEYDR